MLYLQFTKRSAQFVSKMNIARAICPITRSKVGQNFCRNYRISGSNHDSSQVSQPKIQEEKYDFEDLKVLERVERRKPPIQPFMKNIFLSTFDRNLLAFPEILGKEENADLDRRVQLLENTFEDPSKTGIDRRNLVKQARLFAAPCRLTDNGLAMLVTERIRYLETISSDIPLAKELSEHWIALQVLEKGLRTEEYHRLLPQFTEGENTIGICVKEPIPTRIMQEDFRTSAVMDSRGIWKLSGEKEYHSTGKNLIVLAKIEGDRLRAFLVQPQSEGITHKEGLVSFINTPATPLDQISDEALTSIMGLARIDAATACQSILRRAVADATRCIRGRFIAGKPLADLPIIRNKIGASIVTLYAAESALYFTAGLLDGYQAPDADIEMAMCRNFITHHGLSSLLQLLSVPGLQSKEFHKTLEQFRMVSHWDEVDQNVNIFIALNGLHHAGKMLAGEVRQLRNPLHFPKFFFKKIIANRHQEKDEPRLNLYLAEHLHPTLQPSAEALEYCTLRVRYATETLMARHGAEIAGEHADLERLAQTTTEILALTATLARASRSYCIGLRNAEVEMKIAVAFAESVKTRVKTLINDLENGEFFNLDHVKIHLGQKVLDSNSLLTEKPIERVFW